MADDLEINFGTNAGAVAEEVIAALSSIEAAAKRPIDTTALTQNGQALTQGFGRIQQELGGQLGQVRELFNGAAGDPNKLKADYERFFKTALGGIPQMVGREISSISDPTIRGSFDAKGLATHFAQDFSKQIQGEFKRLGGYDVLREGGVNSKSLNLLPRQVRAQFDKNLGGADFYDPNQLSLLQNLRARADAERFVRENPMGRTSEEQRLGLTRLTDQLRRPEEEGGLLRETEQGFAVNPTDTSARLRALEREASTYESAGRSQERVNQKVEEGNKKVARSSEEKAAAERLVNQEYEKAAGRILTPDGGVSKLTTAGVAPEENPVRVAEALNAAEKQRVAAATEAIERANAQRVAADATAKRVGNGLVRTGGLGAESEIYKVTGDRARQLQGQELLDVQDRVLKTLQAQQAAEVRLEATEAKRVRTAEQLAAKAAATADAQAVKGGNQALTQRTRAFQDALSDYENRTKQVNAESLLGTAKQVPGFPSFREGEDGQTYKVASDGSKARLATAYELEQIERKTIEDIKAQAAASAKALSVEERRTTTAAERQAKGNSGFLGGFVNRFQKDDTSFSTGFGQQVASAAGFTLSYGAIFGLQAALRDTLSEFLDYQDSVTDLEVATRNADLVTNSWVSSLGELSRVSGDNVGAALDAAARGVRAFTTEQSSAKEVTDAGSNTARTASQLALIADKPLTDATGDLLASGTAFDLDPRELDQVVDAVANAKRNVGGDAGQISQGLALVGLSAKEAGYDLNQAAAVIGLVQARTDQSGQAIATRLTRIFQIVQGSTGKALGKELGVDTNQSVRQQLETYAKIFSDPSTSEGRKDRITSALGGTANLRELLPLLKEGSTLQNAYKEALDNAGQGLDEYQRKSDNVVGTLKKIKGDLSNLQVGLAKSGLFDFFGAGIKVVEPTLYAFTQLLNLINELPRPLRTALGLATDLAIAAKGISVLQGAGLSLGALTGGALGGAKTAGGAAQAAATTAQATATARLAAVDIAAAEAQTAYAAATARGAGVTEAATVAANAHAAALARETEATVASTAGGLAKSGAGVAEGAAGAGRLGLLGRLAGSGVGRGLGTIAGVAGGPVGIAALGGIAFAAEIGHAIEEARKREGIRSSYSDATSVAYEKVDGSAASLARAAGELDGAAQRIDKVKVNYDGRSVFTDNLRDRADASNVLGYRVAAEQDKINIAQKEFVFGANGAIETFDQLANGLNEIGLNGGTALDQFNALIAGITTPAPKNKELFTPQQLVAATYADLAGATSAQNVPDGTVMTISPRTKKDPNDQSIVPGYDDTYYNPAVTTDNKDQIAAAVKLGLGTDGNTFNLNNLLGQYNPDSPLNQITTAIQDEMTKLGIDGSKGVNKKQRSKLLEAAGAAIPGGANISGRADLIKSIVGASIKGLDDNPLFQPYGTAGNLNSGELNAGQLNEILRGTEATDTTAARPDLASQFSAAMAAIPESDDGTKQLQVYTNYIKFLQYLKEHTPDALADDLSQLNLALANAQHQAASTRIEQLEGQRAAAEQGISSLPALRSVRLGFAKKEQRRAGDDPALVKQLVSQFDKETLDAVRAYLVSQRSIKIALRDSLQRTVAGALSTLLPYLANGDLADAQNAVKSLDSQIDALDKGLKNQVTNGSKVELSSDATSAAEDAKQKIKDRMEAAIEALQLTGDITDPVEQARDELRGALIKLRMDPEKEDRTANLAAVRQARAGVEAAKFTQRLSDVQTAEQLGRISYQTYIRYLENESKRLHGIGNKTRQQIDQMNQIDLALKDATDQADGFFNLGDIRTSGLVYQIRRFADAAKDKTGSTGGGGSFVNSNNTITINGADTRRVRQLLQEMLGPNVKTRGTQSRRV